MNAIYTNQSTRENMDLLYAQARVYDRVKNWNRLNFLFSIIVPLLLSFVTVYNRSREFVDLKWSTKTGHRVRVFSSIDFPIRLVVTHHYIRAVLVRCNIQRYSPLLRELHR